MISFDPSFAPVGAVSILKIFRSYWFLGNAFNTIESFHFSSVLKPHEMETVLYLSSIIIKNS